MFTGIIKDVGIIQSVENKADGMHLAVKSSLVSSTYEGASIAVNGVCLTVLEFDNDVQDGARGVCTFQVIPETLDKTNLSELVEGAKVNLEPALKLNDGIDGHLVQGHVDCTGDVLNVLKDDNGVRIWINYPDAIDEFIVYKGSIAVNGVSLTISKVGTEAEGTSYNDMNYFEIALIEHTLTHSNLGSLNVGDKVNLEIDMMARYASKMLGNKTCDNNNL